MFKFNNKDSITNSNPKQVLILNFVLTIFIEHLQSFLHLLKGKLKRFIDSIGKEKYWTEPVITLIPSQLAITCSKLTIKTLEQGVKYVQS